MNRLHLVVAIGLFPAACAGPSQTAIGAQGGVVNQVPKSEAAITYEQQCQQDITMAREMLGRLEPLTGPKAVATVLEPLNDLWMLLDRGLSTAGLLRNAHPDQAVRAVADMCEQELAKVATDLGLSRPVFEAVAAMDVSTEDAVTQRHVRLVLRDFRRAGVDRDQPTRDRIRALREELVVIGQEFDQNIREDVRSIALDGPEELDGLSPDYITGHPRGADGKIHVTTDYPDYLPFMTYAENDQRRLELYREFRRRGHPKNEAVLMRLLQKRHELAQLLGAPHWAAHITGDKMIKTAEAARAFIDQVAQVSAPRAKRDYDELLAQLRRQTPEASEVGDWQKTFVEEQLKREKYSFDSQALREYFPYHRVRQGVLDITAQMFGLTFQPVEVPRWHPSVEAFEVYQQGDLRGRFFLDMHPREGKYKHAAVFPLQAGVAGRRVPEAALVCNFPGGDGTLGLMEHDDVETFFHEFGHLLHHILGGKQRWVGVSGLAVEWDFVEVPSQILEEWAWEPEALTLFARNAAGEVIPADLMERMRRARDFGKGTMARHQMFYAALSLGYYDRDPGGLNTTDLLRELQSKYSLFRYVEDTYPQLSFGHLDGYSATYYTYMWSLVIAKDLFSVFRKEGLLNPAPAARYRSLILEPGGSKDAEVMVRDFLGRDYSFAAFANWLNAG